MNTVVRLAFRNAICKKDSHYCIKMKDQELDLWDCPTLVDVYLYIYRQDESFKKKISELYDDLWNVSFVLELVQHPELHRGRMETVFEQIKGELPVFSSRPSVGKDNFEICPRRTAIMALLVAEKDLKTLR